MAFHSKSGVFASGNNMNDVADALKNLNNTKDESYNYSKDDINNNMLMAILCYLSILVFVPIFAVKDSKFVKFHANQGLVLFICELIVSAILTVIGMVIGKIIIIGFLFDIISWIISVAFLAVSVVGIFNVITGKAKELPIIGGIRILK